jgi:hypothetical protein
MEIIKSIYRDSNGDIWEIKRGTLPKTRGEFVFWIGECPKKNIELRGNLKRDVIEAIQILLNKPKQ